MSELTDLIERRLAEIARRELGLHPAFHCLLCGVDLIDHDEEACKAKMAAWSPRGITA